MLHVRKTILLLLISILCLATANAQSNKVVNHKTNINDSLIHTPEIQISLLTASPGAEVYEKFGHTAIRVKRGEDDLVFNYGLFNFNAPNFLYRFVKGETDYQLGIGHFQNFTLEYAMRGSQVTEQILNLNQEEAKLIFNALLENYQPENRVYRYNFFFDNCSTRPRDIIEKNIQGDILYSDPQTHFSFRELVYDKTGAASWLTFGIDLTLGANADRIATYREAMFLPEVLMNEFASASINPQTESLSNKQATQSKGHSLVRETVILVEKEPETQISENPLLTPLFLCWSFFLFILLLTFGELRKGKVFRIIDTLIFSIAGVAGCILFFLNFISVHPAVDSNYNCIWLQPLHLFAAIAVWVKSLKRVLYYYHFANFVTLLLLLSFYGLIPQQFNAAFFPLIGVLMLRSAIHIILRLKNRR